MSQAAKPEFSIDLSNQFLMAMPGMVGGELAGTVIYVCEHGPKGALGLVINRPTDLSLSSLFEKIELKLEINPLQGGPVFFGGPVQTDRGFVLHTPLGEYTSSIKLGALALTTSRDVLQEVAAGKGPEKVFWSTRKRVGAKCLAERGGRHGDHLYYSTRRAVSGRFEVVGH